jgi:glycosyltransferase involved in cell wall biosynthesis
MIVKDEEEVLERCLTSISDLVDEIVIVDTGSQDKTIEIAKKFTDKIYYFEWIDDFSAARNYSYSKATKDYILWLDADDVLYEEDRKKFKELKETLDTTIDSVTMKYNVGFDNDGNVTFSYRRNRLVKKSNNFKWEGACHNLLVVKGNILDSDIGIAHKKIKARSNRNLKIYQNRIKKGDKFNARDIFYYANELYDHKLYEEALIYYIKLLKMSEGWFENKIYACGRVADYYISIKKYNEAFRYCFKSFEYTLPRAEICCRLGGIFRAKKRYTEAIYWYKLATTLQKPKSHGFFRDACWTWIPYLELCVCYDRIGNYDEAYKCNEVARSYVPSNKSVINNVNYFNKLGHST